VGEGPLKTGLLKTAEILKAAGVRETTLPPMDMSRISDPTFSLGDMSGLVPALDSAYGWGGALTPIPVFNGAMEIESGAGGIWVDSFGFEVAGANNEWSFFTYGPEATRMTAGFAVGVWQDAGAIPIRSRLLVGEINPAVGPVPSVMPLGSRNLGSVDGGFYLRPGLRLMFFSNPAAAQVFGGWIKVREVPST